MIKGRLISYNHFPGHRENIQQLESYLTQQQIDEIQQLVSIHAFLLSVFPISIKITPWFRAIEQKKNNNMNKTPFEYSIIR